MLPLIQWAFHFHSFYYCPFSAPFQFEFRSPACRRSDGHTDLADASYGGTCCFHISPEHTRSEKFFISALAKASHVQWDDSHHRLVHLSEYRPFLGAGVDLLMVSMNLQVSTCMLTPNPSDARTAELRSLFCTLQEHKLCLSCSSLHWLGLSH